MKVQIGVAFRLWQKTATLFASSPTLDAVRLVWSVRRIAVWLLALLFLVAACSGTEEAYRGPELQSDQVALLSTSGSGEGFDSMIVVAVDGLQRSGGNLGSVFRGGSWGTEKLLPGLHEISTHFSFPVLPHDVFIKGPSPDIEGSANILLLAEAGHKYRIRGVRRFNFIRLWIEDTETKSVAGMTTLHVPPWLYE